MLRMIAGAIAPHRFPASPLPNHDKLMTAVVMNSHGNASVLHTEEFPTPKPAPSTRQIVIKIAAAGLNPVDFKMRKGPIADFIYPKPKIIGSDISGIVVEAPEDSSFAVGQRVFAMLPLLGTAYGGYAEYCCVDESLVALAPDTVSLVELATAPLVACTVVQALRGVIEAYGGDTKGKKCFVQAGSGGLGMMALQYCANVLEMEVTTSCSERNRDLLLSLGASKVIDYHSEKIEDHIVDFDVFFDIMGYQNENLVLENGKRILKSKDSHYIRIASSPYGNEKDGMGGDPMGLAIPEARLDRMVSGFRKALFSKIFGKVRYHFVFVHPEKHALEIIANAMKEGKIKSIIQERFALSEAQRAHEMLETGHVTGKLVFVVDPDSQ